MVEIFLNHQKSQQLSKIVSHLARLSSLLSKYETSSTRMCQKLIENNLTALLYFGLFQSSPESFTWVPNFLTLHTRVSNLSIRVTVCWGSFEGGRYTNVLAVTSQHGKGLAHEYYLKQAHEI